MTPDDLFNINTGIVKSLCTAIAKYCPNALVNMISNSVNSMPNAAKVFKKAGTYDPKRLFGMTFLDVVKTKMLNPGTAGVPVEAANVETKTLRLSTKKTQDGGTEVVEAKAGKSSATLPMGYYRSENSTFPSKMAD